MAPKKYYAVARGRETGIFLSWDECKKQVDGFSGPIYKSFKSREEAEAFLRAHSKSEGGAAIYKDEERNLEEEIEYIQKKLSPSEALVFIDGSYLAKDKKAGYGIVYVKKDSYQFVSNKAEGDLSLRNVLGEILAAMEATRMAIEDGLRGIYIFYDYTGLEYWATGAWKRNKELTKSYYEYMNEAKNKINISFHKVDAHKGVVLNEKADELAKEGAKKS